MPDPGGRRRPPPLLRPSSWLRASRPSLQPPAARRPAAPDFGAVWLGRARSRPARAPSGPGGLCRSQLSRCAPWLLPPLPGPPAVSGATSSRPGLPAVWRPDPMPPAADWSFCVSPACGGCLVDGIKVPCSAGPLSCQGLRWPVDSIDTPGESFAPLGADVGGALGYRSPC